MFRLEGWFKQAQHDVTHRSSVVLTILQPQHEVSDHAMKSSNMNLLGIIAECLEANIIGAHISQIHIRH